MHRESYDEKKLHFGFLSSGLFSVFFAFSVISVDSVVKRDCGHFIHVGSIAGHTCNPNGNVYCATKFAVRAIKSITPQAQASIKDIYRQ